MRSSTSADPLYPFVHYFPSLSWLFRPEMTRQLSGGNIHLLNLSRRATQSQRGLLDGGDPTEFDTTDPLRLWIIQVGIIIAMTSFLAAGLRRFRQPKVFAEILGGILLGPSGLGRIPGFTEHIFPPQSIPYLSLVANIGLCLFLFLVGLGIDVSQIRKTAKLSVIVTLFGTVIPFGVGCGIALPLYNTFIKIGAPQADTTLTGPDGHGVPFTHFMLFTGVAFSVTGFPVVCRILAELNLWNTTVGVVSLWSGVATSVVGWILLVLSVALVNADSGLTALWSLFLCIAWTVFMSIPVRKAMLWLAIRTGSTERGPTTLFMTVTILVMFGSSFFIDIIGVNAIFGALIAGLAIPREGHLSIILKEKMEDIVSIVFIPLYFALSGLSTDLGLLDNGITWAFTVSIIFLAFASKFSGSTLASYYLSNVNLREASTIGALMSCKGLVELIVLNVGLSAGILNNRVFSMFVLEALTLTFTTTPMVEMLYPPRFRVVPGLKNAVDLQPDVDSSRDQQNPTDWKAHDGVHGVGRVRQRFAVVLQKFDHLPAAMTATHSVPAGSLLPPHHSTHLSIVRLVEMTERTADMVTTSAPIVSPSVDPLLSTYQTFVSITAGRTGGQSGLTMSDIVEVVPAADKARIVGQYMERENAEVVLISWTFDASSSSPTVVSSPKLPNPFGSLFGNLADSRATSSQTQFVYDMFNQVGRIKAVLLYLDTSKSRQNSGVEYTPSAIPTTQHLFCPFFGGADGRLALEMVVQMCMREDVTATVVRLSKVEDTRNDLTSIEEVRRTSTETVSNRLSSIAFSNSSETVLGDPESIARLQNGVLDELAWAQCVNSGLTRETAKTSWEVQLVEALGRITFKEVKSSVLLKAAVDEAQEVVDTNKDGRVVVVMGRSGLRVDEELNGLHHDGMPSPGIGAGLGADTRKAIGGVASSFILANVGDGVLVAQAGSEAQI
ncbi:hypothetical protein BDN72DRAFT_822745 [Pluteus cervinus]|uniref:Uncharacterized protein n=1 Tax=Pluteus cervinus TaxID=181527 RepID=A0ACD3AND5_9AGAR|nr:hypothetical protein BDN72DRAFT_822745 [Pluteus cervinus]